MKNIRTILGICLPAFIGHQFIQGYGLRNVNLGLTNFLDGGPLRPRSGVYWINYEQYYYTNFFADHEGNALGGVPSPTFNALSTINQLLYESKKTLFGARLGTAASLGLVFLSSITDNLLGFSSSGAGWTDLRLDIFLQWNPVMYHGRALFVTNLDIGAFFPTGKNQLPCHTINPGSNVYALNPYWAATLYLTEQWTIAWRLHYLWSSENHTIHFKAGDAIHMNFSMETQMSEHFHLGVNGYFLKQLHNNTRCDLEIPDSRERVVGLGPGFIYYLPKSFIFLGHVYGEFAARNRGQGINCVLRLIKYF